MTIGKKRFSFFQGKNPVECERKKAENLVNIPCVDATDTDLKFFLFCVSATSYCYTQGYFKEQVLTAA